jgi:hypothetical protein
MILSIPQNIVMVLNNVMFGMPYSPTFVLGLPPRGGF